MTDIISQKLIDANMKFSFKLLAEIMNIHVERNIFLSPISIAMALAMVYNGANGNNREAIKHALELQELNINEVNAAYAALKERFSNLKEPSNRNDVRRLALNRKLRFVMANALWGDKTVEFLPEYAELGKEIFGVNSFTLDLGNPDCLRIINDWVYTATSGEISQTIGHFDPASLLVIVSAVYFNARWSQPFEHADTDMGRFKLLNGSHKKCLMMRRESDYFYRKTDVFEIIGLPYSDEVDNQIYVSPISMYIFFFRTWDSILTTFPKRTLRSRRAKSGGRQRIAHMVTLCFPNSDSPTRLNLKAF